MVNERWNKIEKIIQETLGCASIRSLSTMYPADSIPSSYQADINISNNLLRGSIHEVKSDVRLIHYTSVQSLFEIVNSKKLRLFNARAMNDPLEMYNMLADFEFFTPELIKSKTENVFFTSFCEYEDSDKNNESFSMWRNYAQNGSGVGIVFKLGNHDIENRWIDYALGKVSYQKASGSKNNVREFFRQLEALKQTEKFSIDEVPNVVYQLAALHKSEIWSEEKEVRLFKFLDWDKHDWFYSEKTNFDYPEEIRAMMVGNTIKYYIELDLDNQARLNQAKALKEKHDKIKDKSITFTPERVFDIYPSLSIKKVIFGYGLEKNMKYKIFENINRMIKKQLNYSVEYRDSKLTEFFQLDK